MVIQRLLFGVLDVAVTCVHELVEDICRYRSAFDPLEPRLGCLIMLSSIPRRLFSDVLLAAEPAARRASARRLQSFTDRAFRTQQDRTSLRKAHHTALGNISVCSTPVENAAHSAPRELLTNRRILREFQASTDTVEELWRKMFGCAAMIT